MLKNRKLRITNYELPLAIIIVLVVSLVFATTAFAQDGTPTDDEVNKIAKQLFCPVCESTPLDVCPTQACHDWRELIREMLADGKSEAEIKQYFVEHFGARVLNEPPNKFASYAVPAAAFLLGAFMLFRGFQMWMKPVKTGPAVPESEAKPIPQDEYIARLEEELKKQK